MPTRYFVHTNTGILMALENNILEVLPGWAEITKEEYYQRLAEQQ